MLKYLIGPVIWVVSVVVANALVRVFAKKKILKEKERLLLFLEDRVSQDLLPYIRAYIRQSFFPIGGARDLLLDVEFILTFLIAAVLFLCWWFFLL